MSFFRAQRAQSLRSTSCSSANLAICADFRRIGVNQITYGNNVASAPPVPSAPTGLTYAFNGASVILSFTPGSDNGNPITNYQYSVDGLTFTSLNTTTLPLTISGLTTGTTYSITVRAVNADGPGTSSAPISVTTVTKIPGSLRFTGTNKLDLSPGVTIGPGAYTVECWFYNNSGWGTVSPNYAGLLGHTGASGTGLAIWFASNNSVQTDRNGGSFRPIYTFANSITLNAWHHFVLVRNSFLVETVFIDGVKASSASAGDNISGGQQTNTYDYAGNSVEIGRFYQGYWPGYLANFRIVVGNAVYDPTAALITVPTSALTNITGTKYLMNGSTITNDGSSTQTVTNVSGVTLSTTQVPF